MPCITAFTHVPIWPCVSPANTGKLRHKRSLLANVRVFILQPDGRGHTSHSYLSDNTSKELKTKQPNTTTKDQIQIMKNSANNEK